MELYYGRNTSSSSSSSMGKLLRIRDDNLGRRAALSKLATSETKLQLAMQLFKKVPTADRLLLPGLPTGQQRQVHEEAGSVISRCMIRKKSICFGEGLSRTVMKGETAVCAPLRGKE